MTNLILQPAGGAGTKNFENTIVKPVSTSDLELFLNDKDIQELKDLYPSLLVPVWGVTNGQQNRNKNKWDKIEIGDVTLFTGDMRIFATGIVTKKIKNEKLALNLWGREKGGSGWENIYFLKDITKCDIPVNELNRLLGYNLKNPVRGFTVLTEEKSKSFFEEFNIGSSLHSPKRVIKRYEELLDEIEKLKVMDRKIESLHREEQQKLREYLLEGKSKGTCSICQKEMPANLLIASHIKKRSKCTDTEKRDVKNNVTLMCKMGCDDLFEKGYISIQMGDVISLNKKNLTEEVENYINNIVGNTCLTWTSASNKYFDWHYKFHTLKK